MPTPAAPRPKPASRRERSSEPLLVRTAHAIRALPDHRWLDRLVRGRAWIPVLGVLLIGIVFMQVEVLKLGASVGRSMTLGTELQARNELLKAEVAGLSNPNRIEQIAARMGMRMPGPTEVAFVPADGAGRVDTAISRISAPDASTFSTALLAQETANGDQPATTTPSTSTTTPATTTGAAAGTDATAPTTVDTETTPVSTETDTNAPSTTATAPTDPAADQPASDAGTTDSSAGDTGSTEAATTEPGTTDAPATSTGSGSSTAGGTGLAAPTGTTPSGTTSSGTGGAGVATGQ
jgi:cell division protein FtsL